MTDGERLATGIAVSLGLHALLLGGIVRPAAHDTGTDVTIVDIALPESGLSLAPPITLEEAAPAADPAQPDVADRKRAAMQDFVEAVLRAIHARRMAENAGERLIGNASFAVTIAADGRFSDVLLLRGSGNDALDRDAAHAVAAASGSIPRPPILGGRPIRLVLTVKYQFGL